MKHARILIALDITETKKKHSQVEGGRRAGKFKAAEAQVEHRTEWILHRPGYKGFGGDFVDPALQEKEEKDRCCFCM